MRDTAFENNLFELRKQIHQKVTSVSNSSRQQICVLGLAAKCLSHTDMALELVVSNALAEAMIVLRAAYEAIIRAIYLAEHEDKVKAYEAFSTISTLRNQLEVLKILDEFGEPYEDQELQKQLVQRQKQHILAEEHHLLYGLAEADLDSWERVKRVSNRSNLPNFEEMRRALQLTPITKALLGSGFQIYNLGSQMTHSSHEMMTAMVYFGTQHPLYTERTVYTQALLLMLCCCHCYVLSQAMAVTEFESLRAQYQRVGRLQGLAG